ncbi:MAG: T9SS type A sorting domain-containing protein [Owenweeksia sp.]|nr:T9SS type A sorting domain-containing protein [Owenweeksia sp.]
MIRTITLSVLFILALQASMASSLRQSLIDVNAQWAYRTVDLSTVMDEDCDYSSNEIIKEHLLRVHQLLSQKEVGHLSSAERKNRAASLEDLLRYAQRAVFPKNLTHQVRRPIFIDHRGVHCAVGYLISQSGHAGLSQRISANMNARYLKDMQDPLLSKWVAQSGFTLDELAWVQPGYPFLVDWDPMKGGVNGPVSAIISDQMSGVYTAGSFDTAGTMHTENQAHWFAGVAGYGWTGFFGSGTNGPVHTMLRHQSNLYLAGAFNAVDTVFSGSGVAMWDGSQWHGLGDFYVGGISNYVNDLAVYRDTLYAAGFFRSKSSAPKAFRNLAKWDGNAWVPATDDTALPAIIPGELHSLHVHNGKLVVAGDFQLANSQQTRNIFRLNGNAVEWYAQDIPNPVYALETYNGELFAGGLYTGVNYPDTAGLTVYRNNQWESLVPFYSGNSSAVYALEATPLGLVLGGDFMASGGMNSYSHNVLAYNNGQLYDLGNLDAPVECLHFENDRLYLGGLFTSRAEQGGSEELGNITSMYLPDYLSDREEQLPSFSMYPNPTRNELNVQWPASENFTELRLTDLSGRAHKVPYTKEGHQLKADLSGVPTGTYLLELELDGVQVQKKLLVTH